MQDGLFTLSFVWFITGQVWAAASDALRMRIPNALILYLLAGAAMCAAVAQPNWADIAAHVAVGLAILGVGLVLFARGWMGGGERRPSTPFAVT
jgi:prepilin peptidase CpaA